jgi:hypothetical protein
LKKNAPNVLYHQIEGGGEVGGEPLVKKKTLVYIDRVKKQKKYK